MRIVALLTAAMMIACAGEQAESQEGAKASQIEAGWQSTTAAPIAGRTNHGAIWTGESMVVFGGEGTKGALGDGASYNPASKTWQMLPAGPLSARRHPAMVWTGREVVIHGGIDAESAADGASFDPATSTWTSLPAAPLSARALPAYAYAPTTHELVLFGGQDLNGPRADGMAFNTETRTWRTIAPSPMGARAFARGVWTGQQILFFGGLDESGKLTHDAATYDPATDRWSLVAGAISARADVSAVATDNGAVFFGGQTAAAPDGCPAALNDGATFDSATKALVAIPSATTLRGARAESAAWYGAGRLFVFGGYRCDEILDDAASFDGKTWSSLPKSDLSPRYGATAVWTGEAAIVWGGAASDGARLNDGATYRP